MSPAAAQPVEPTPPRPPRTGESAVDDEWADAVFERADLSNTVLARAGLVRSRLVGCRMTGFQMPSGVAEDVAFLDCRLDLAALRMTDCRRVAFRDCVLRELDFYDARLRDVSFEDCDLTGADFSRARCTRVALRRCRVDGLRGTDGLRGVLVDWEDVLALAGPLAVDAGLLIRE